MWKANGEMALHLARRQARDAVRNRNGRDTYNVHNVPVDSHALVYRSEKDRSEGLFSISDIEGEHCTLLLWPPSGPSRFITVAVKRHLFEKHDLSSSEGVENAGNFTSNNPTINRKDIENPYTTRIEFGKFDRFRELRLKEVTGSCERGVFENAEKAEAGGLRIFCSPFVDTIEDAGKPHAYKKTRLVVQGFNDRLSILTHDPTVQCAFQRLHFALAACNLKLVALLGDVQQAHTQAEDPLKLPISVYPPSALGYPRNVVFKAIRPLYGIPEAGIQWFKTYQTYHVEDLHLT